MRVSVFCTLILLLIQTENYGQLKKGEPEYFDAPILMDSLSTLFIPVLYNASLFSSEKIAVSGDYYANIIVYDFKVDQYRPLFPRNTFIEPVTITDYYSRGVTKMRNRTKDLIFFRVKTVDYTGNKRIDEFDPFVLYVSTRNGTNLKRLTPENENVAGLEIFEKQGFVLVKLQRDSDGDRSFRAVDNAFYFLKIDLRTLEVGHPIEISKEL
ncbi:MAG TPA: hypothetical protein VGK59_07135 [Ohtaekwangia sp.]